MTNNGHQAGFLLLEDGTSFTGSSFLGSTTGLGEAVFNTSHTGYQEIISDPSYFRQIVTFTAPHIGNIGTNPEDLESTAAHASGVVVRSLAPSARNWRSSHDLSVWLAERQIPLLTGTNTRAITLHLRQRGAMRAGLFSAATDPAEALSQVLASDSMVAADLASGVTCKQKYLHTIENLNSKWYPKQTHGQGLNLAVLDFGVKLSILNELATRGCKVTVLPATTPAEEILSGKYDGLLISNGPGDPASVLYGVATIKKLLENRLPLFGICLGHQLLALAIGGSTFKLPFGHRGANHPVRREEDKVIEITSQNHGFAVNPEGLGEDWRVTHINLNDQTVEGLRHQTKPAFSIQYHPEASPGPHEGRSYFDQFISEVHRAKA